MPSPASITRIDEYWIRRFWCSEEELSNGSTSLRTYPSDASHRFNIIAARRLGGGCVINVHEHLFGAISHFQGARADEVFDERVLRELYGADRVELGITAVQAYADAGDVRIREAPVPVKILDSADGPGVAELRSAVSTADWSEASMDEAIPPVFAAVVDGRAVAVAHAVLRGGLRHIGVLTAPDYRGRGLARGAATALARHFSQAGQILEWQARSSNAPSVAIRDALGFVERYRTITLRVASTSSVP